MVHPFYTIGMNEDKTQDYTDIQTAVLYMIHKRYANNWPQNGLRHLHCYLYFLWHWRSAMHKGVLGMHRFVLGSLPCWFVLWFLFVLPIGAAEQTWSQILFSTLQSVCLRLSLLLSGRLFRPLSRLRWTSTQVGKKHLEWYFDPGLLLNEQSCG